MYSKDYIWKPATCSCENGKHLTSIINDSAIMCDEIKDTTKTVLTKAVPPKITSTNLLTTIALLIAVRIYYFQIKYLAKQKYLFS